MSVRKHPGAGKIKRMLVQCLRFDEMHEIANKHGGRCLSPFYLGSRKKLLWKCKAGHQWMAHPNSIKRRKSWCQKCSRKGRPVDNRSCSLTIEDMQEIARTRGGRCLSLVYLGKDEKLQWQCAAEHQWTSTPGSVKHGGTWCPYCAGNSLLTIEEMQEIARARGGQCLSPIYLGIREKLQWQCKAEHKWMAAPGNIKNSGTWCPHCAGKSLLTIEDMQEIARAHRGQCLSLVYLGNKKELQWKCAAKHQWMATPKHIRNSAWCPVCAAVEDMLNTALHPYTSEAIASVAMVTKSC